MKGLLRPLQTETLLLGMTDGAFTKASLLQSVLLLILLASAHAWVLGGKKGGKDAPGERNVKIKAPTRLPPTSFVRIFALPSEEAKLAQVLPCLLSMYFIATALFSALMFN